MLSPVSVFWALIDKYLKPGVQMGPGQVSKGSLGKLDTTSFGVLHGSPFL